MPPQRVWFLCRYGLKTGIDFAHFGLELSIVFEGATMVYEHICQLMVPNKIRNKPIICEFEMDFKKSSCWHSDLSKHECCLMTSSRSENGYGF